MMHGLNDTATKTINRTKTTQDAVNCFLNCCACNPNTIIMFWASDMVLQINSDRDHLAAPKARSQGSGHHFLGDHEGILFNAPVCVLAKVLKHVTASVAETKLGAICANAQEATLFRQTLQDMGHPQGPTPVKADDTTADGIVSEKMKAKCLKGADNRLHWMKDRAAQGQFNVCWESAETNLADCTSTFREHRNCKRAGKTWQ